MDILHNNYSDPRAGNTKHFLQIQTVGYSGSYADLICPAVANYPPESPTRYFIMTNWLIDVTDLAGSRPILIKDVTSATVLSPTSSAPGVNEYFVSPSTAENRGWIELNAGQAGHTIAFDGYIDGGVFNANDAMVIYRTSAGVESRVRRQIKEIDLGAWNMYFTGGGDSAKTINHGVTNDKSIIILGCIIYTDTVGDFYSLNKDSGASFTIDAGGSTIIIITTGAGGFFDNNGFDSLLVERGKLIIMFEE